MLSCIYNGKPFTTRQDGFTRDQKYKLARNNLLLCPYCQKPVFYCHDGLKIAHFTHKEVGDCPEGTLKSYDYSDTTKHLRLTGIFIEWIQKQFPDIEVIPDFLINREMKTDIFFKLGTIKIAIEIQIKDISTPNFIKRREIYKNNGIKDIWFFIVEEENYPVGSTYHRAYYHGNKRELYFYQVNELNCKVYKGFAGEKWEVVGNDTLVDYVSAEVPLEHIKIGNAGMLFIPELYNKYFQKLKAKREENKQRREAKKKYRELQEQYIKESILAKPYKTSNGFFDIRQNAIDVEYKMVTESKPSKVNVEAVPKKAEKKYSKVTMDKANIQEYKEKSFKTVDGKEYFHIVIIYEGKEYDVKYLILKKQIEKNEIYLDCRKEYEAENIRYNIDINPFLDSMRKVKIQRYELT